MSQYEFIDKRVPIALDNPSIYHDISKCKNCTLCRRACADVMSVLDYYDLDANGYEPGTFLEGKMVGALRALGADYVVDTNFGADLTIMEEASELVERLKTGGQIPQFTSCCPAWVRFAEIYFPELIPNLSSTRSCIAMEAAMIKTYFAEKKGINPSNIVSVSVNPCTAKKSETKREEENAAARFYDDESLGMDTDISITTREFIRWIQEENLDFNAIEESQFDDLIGMETGASIIFGNTGGVMEAALRSAHYLVTGRNPDPDAFKIVRSPSFETGVVEAEVQIGDATIRAAVVSGLGNVRKLLEAIEHGEVHYDFVEVMACPGGCVGGGGQPIHDGEELAHTRGANLYFLDKNAKIRFSHENQDVMKLYNDFLEKPLSHKSHMLLHTDHTKWDMPR